MSGDINVDCAAVFASKPAPTLVALNRLALAPEGAFFFRFVFEGAFRPLAVVGKDAGFDLTFLREGNALHVERLIGCAFDLSLIHISEPTRPY